MDIKPLLNPCEDYEVIKPSCEFRFDRHSFSFNYIHEIDWAFASSALRKISKDGKTVNIDDILPYIEKLNTIERARLGRGTQFKNTENYEIFLRYSVWELDKVKHSILASGVDLTQPISLTMHFAKLAKYDVDGLAKAFIDAFARYFLNGNDDNVVEIHLTAHNINTQKEGFIDVIVENI